MKFYTSNLIASIAVLLVACGFFLLIDAMCIWLLQNADPDGTWITTPAATWSLTILWFIATFFVVGGILRSIILSKRVIPNSKKVKVIFKVNNSSYDGINVCHQGEDKYKVLVTDLAHSFEGFRKGENVIEIPANDQQIKDFQKDCEKSICNNF